jgi:hypothetical protein
VSFWQAPVEMPFPPGEDAEQTAWWGGLHPFFQARWAPLLAELGPDGRRHFQAFRRNVARVFRQPAGTAERRAEEDGAEEQLYQRVAARVARGRARETAAQAAGGDA